ncbi:MAG: phage tail tape measure C-terminal domain-containing protein [Alphaproteobacteria bacterium]|nr:phage tail tape measure C-terminal domain-containing protein [Alphaproteobacteria bacterium]
MADLGSLVVKLSAETSEFRADLGRTARLLDRHANDMKASMQQVATVAKTAFAVAVGAASVGALRDFIDRTIEATAALQQLSEQTGASTTALSGLAPVAIISGTAMETIGTNLSKLSKALAGVDDEGANASKALQFLGITAKDSGGNLRDPAEVLNDVALKLAEFEDGAGKTALAMDLFGKSGASMLPFLKDLAENQNLNIRLTAQQIEEADKASKAMARMRAESSFVSQTLVTSAIPALSVLSEELKKILFGTDNAVTGISRLRDDGTLAKWAETSAYAIAVLVDSLRAIFQGIKSIVGSFQAVWADIELAGGFIARGGVPGLLMEGNRKALREALDKRNQIVEQANRNYVELWNMPLLADAVTQRFDEMRRNAQAGANPQGDKPLRPTLNYNTASDANRAEALAGIERDVKRLQDALDVEAALLKDRQRIIDLYEGQGFLTFKEGSDARIAAQDDFTERLRANMAEEEAILKRGLATVAKTTQEKAKLTARLEEVMARRARLEREVQMSGLERSIREPGEAFKTTLADIEQRSKALQALADDEAAIMRSRQRVIDLYQEQGYLRFREATDLRANAQQEYLERSRAYFDQEEALLRTALETVAKTADQRRQIEERLATLAAKRQRMEREAAQVTLERAIRSPFEALRDIQERASRAESEFKTREEQIRLLRESGAISELESLRRLATAREESARQLEQLAAEARAVAESAPGNERFAESMRQIAESARTAAAGAKELGQRAKEIAEPFTAGFQKGLKSFIEDAEAMGKQIEYITSRAFNGMTDALTQFVMTGKLDFKSLANSIISDLIRIQIQRAITVPLANAMMGFFGFAGGGVMTSAGPMALRSYASGGVANSPQLALFGEGSRPEAYVPLPDGRSIPVTMSGSASGGDVFNISVSVSDAGASSRGDDPGGRDLGRAIASAVRQELLAQKRAGGLLDSRRAV